MSLLKSPSEEIDRLVTKGWYFPKFLKNFLPIWSVHFPMHCSPCHCQLLQLSWRRVLTAIGHLSYVSCFFLYETVDKPVDVTTHNYVCLSSQRRFSFVIIIELQVNKFHYLAIVTNLLHCWSFPQNKGCSQNSTQVALSFWPCGYLEDSSHCTLTGVAIERKLNICYFTLPILNYPWGT